MLRNKFKKFSDSSNDDDVKFERVLLGYNEIPDWCKDNNFITHGYRPISNSVRLSLKSIYNQLHNESSLVYLSLLMYLILI